MVICSQHKATRTFGQSTLTVGPWGLCMAQKWQLGSSDQKMEAISYARLAQHHWEKPLEKEKPRVLGHKGSQETVGKVLKRKVGPMLQNQQNIGGISGNKRVCQRTERFHTLDDACLANERENCSHRKLTFEQFNQAIRVITVGYGGPISNGEDWARWEPGFRGRIKL